MSAASGLIKVIKKGATAPAKAAPFYSAVDEVAQGLSRNKGTGKEFLREIEKTKGVKPAEIKDRKLDKILNTDQKMTKDDLVKVLEDNPPKQITEDIMGDTITPEMIEQKIDDMIHEDVIFELGPRPKLGYEREDWLEDYDRLIEQKNQYRDNYYEPAKNSIHEEGGFGTEKYSEYKLPGGENYREILLKLPTFDPNKERQLMQLEAYQRRGATNKAMDEELARLKAEKESFGGEFRTPHWDQPNVLAHMRVQDRVGPNGEKVLHVEEIQSDWHQAGRKKGYGPKTERTVEAYYETKDGQRIPVGFGKTKEEAEASIDVGWKNLVDIKYETFDKKIGEGVPDAPFKNTWHELAMKRLINYASENGYDKIAITPGVEQANRYKMSSFINNMTIGGEHAGLRQISWMPKDGRAEQALKFDKEGNVKQAMISELQGKNISDIFGKDLAEEIIQSKPYRRIEGVDLNVGGEGMKGFYDQMLPAYLNKYGEKYGAKVGQLPISSGEKMIPDNAGLGMIRSGEPELTQLHSFDITPQMREEVLTKGQPLYQQIGIPAATGAAGAGMLEEEFDFKRGGKVSVTDNPDTMFLELNDQHFGVGGAAKKAVKALKGTQKVLPAAEREENLQKFLGDSRIRDRLYHATPKSFKQFKPGGDDPTLSGPAIWLTPNAKIQPAAHNISSRSQEFKEGTNVMPVYAQARSPLLLDDELSIEWAREVYADGSREFPDLLSPKTIEELKKGGYDSIIHADPYGNRGGEQEIIMFDPNRIKSAIGNRGTYDTTQPDINEARGGLVTIKRK